MVKDYVGTLDCTTVNIRLDWLTLDISMVKHNRIEKVRPKSLSKTY